MSFLRKEYNVKKIGAHGESLGGMVVCHLAKHSNLEFACADRTFSSLSDVAYLGFGSVAGILYRLLTGWSDDSNKNFVDAKCYKIVTFDPKDEMIPLLASLRQSISKHVIERLLGLDVQQTSTPKKKFSAFSLRALSLFKIRFSNRLSPDYKPASELRSIQEYSELLTPNQATTLFHALRRLTDVFMSLSKYETISPRFRKKAHQSHSDESSPNKLPYYKKENNTANEGASLDTSMNISIMSDKVIGDDLDESTPINPIHSSLQRKRVNDTSILGGNVVSLLDENRRLDEAIKEKVDIQKEFPIDNIQNKSYLPLLIEEDLRSEEFQRFIFKVNFYSTLQLLNFYQFTSFSH